MIPGPSLNTLAGLLDVLCQKTDAATIVGTLYWVQLGDLAEKLQVPRSPRVCIGYLVDPR